MHAEQSELLLSLTGKAPSLWSHAATFLVKQRPHNTIPESVIRRPASVVSALRPGCAHLKLRSPPPRQIHEKRMKLRVASQQFLIRVPRGDARRGALVLRYERFVPLSEILVLVGGGIKI